VWQQAKNKSYDGVQLFHKLQDDLYDAPGNNSSEIEALCAVKYTAQQMEDNIMYAAPLKS
jgi:hypothetical protein